MKKIFFTFLPFFIFILLILSRVNIVYANSKPIIMPPTVEGPGLILPESPFYFLDRFRQSLRIFFAFTPENKAVVYESIAGERISQLRVELAKGNIAAAEIALGELRYNTRNAADQLLEAQFLGKDVKDLAIEINTGIKRHISELATAEAQASGETKAGLAWAQSSLLDAKYKVESALPKDQLANEIHDDMLRNITELTSETIINANQLKQDISVLQQQANSAAQNNLLARQQALNMEVSEKNDQLKKIAQDKFTAEKRKDDLTVALQGQALIQAQEVADKAKAVQDTFQASQEVANASDINAVLGISNNQSQLFLTPTPIPTQNSQVIKN